MVVDCSGSRGTRSLSKPSFRTTSMLLSSCRTFGSGIRGYSLCRTSWRQSRKRRRWELKADRGVLSGRRGRKTSAMALVGEDCCSMRCGSSARVDLYTDCDVKQSEFQPQPAER